MVGNSTLARIAVGAALVAVAVTATATPAVAAAPEIQIADGRTQPTFSYQDAVREKVFVTTPTDSDNDGAQDRVALYITRPKETESGLKVASIVHTSPYFWDRGLDSQVQWHPVDVVSRPQLAPWQPPTGPRRLVESWVYNDNYFVPRGYAVIKASTLGTGESSGCVTTLGSNERLAMKAVVDWLNGRAEAHTEDGRPVAADWSTGNVAMTGKSYEGTLPLGAATTGVPGLKTVVSIMGVSNWYDAYRRNGAVISGPVGYNGEDADIHSKVVLTRENPERCATSIHTMERDMDRVSGDYNAFWDERNFLDDVQNFPPTFLVAGLRDTSVPLGQFAGLWRELGRHDIPRKAWILQAGHDDPLYVAEQRWLDAVHAWYDHWLYGVDNGITDEPAVDFETAPGQWRLDRQWPSPRTSDMTYHLGSGHDGIAQPGVLTPQPNARGLQGFVDAPKRSTHDLVGDPTAADPNRLLYVTEPLPEGIRLSGTPQVRVRASVDGQSPYLSAILVDLGRDERVSGFTPTDDRWCFGPDGPGHPNGTPDPGCRPRWEYQTAVSDHYVVSRGWMDVRNRHSDSVTDPIDAGVEYDFGWDMEPNDYVFKAGHRIGLMIVSTDYDHTLHYPEGTRLTVRVDASSVTLPLAPATS